MSNFNELTKLINLGYQQITVTTAQSLTVPVGTRVVIFNCETQAVRWRDDKTAPTASVGMPLAVAAEPIRYTGNASQLQFIAQVAGGIINVSYYGY